MASSASPTASAAPVKHGRVRSRRFAYMMVPSAAAAAALVMLTANGAIAAQFSISGLPFTVTATDLHGTGFEQYGGLDNMIDNSPNAGSTGGQELVAISAIKSATLTHLCQSINLGGINLLIQAGGGKSPVLAKDLVADSSQLSGNATFHHINIGQDASTVTEVPGIKGPPGDFAQQADTVDIQNLRQVNYSTTASSFTLPGFSLKFSSRGC